MSKWSGAKAFGTNTGGGFTDQNAREFLIRNIGRTTSLEDLRNIVVTTIEGVPSCCGRSRTSTLAQGQARCRLHEQARRDRLGREAAQCRYGAADADHAGARGAGASPPSGVKANEIIFSQASFIENSIQNVERVLFKQPSSWPSSCSRFFSTGARRPFR